MGVENHQILSKTCDLYSVISSGLDELITKAKQILIILVWQETHIVYTDNIIKLLLILLINLSQGSEMNY